MFYIVVHESADGGHPPEWLGTTAAASYLGITPRTLYRLIDRGQLPAYALGRVYRVRRGDLDAYLASVRVVPGSLGHLHGAASTSGAGESVTPPP